MSRLNWHDGMAQNCRLALYALVILHSPCSKSCKLKLKFENLKFPFIAGETWLKTRFSLNVIVFFILT